MRTCLIACLLLPVFTVPLAAQDKKSVEQLAEDAKDSIAVLLYSGRDGKQQGLGTGFVISADGLIATNLHVIGEARPITVQLADGSKHEATAVHASDKKLDLAIVKIDAKRKLTPLPLGDSGKLKQGQALVAIGHPQGLKHSVVAGVLSGKRDFDGVSMLQLAIPIEQGNSGGPVLDVNGKVVGIVTMKSLVTANLGFAVPVNALKHLHEKPNPVAMEQWLTIGALDPAEWKSMLAGRWRQRAGRIIADGVGSGFGGRTLCLSQKKPLELPYELTVTVKLDDEKGAAGLIFGGDADGKHYGFYPTGGKIRLTRFAGPDVYSWKILFDQQTNAYRPGEWNTIKVRMEKDKFICFINDEKITELADPDYFGGVVGLAKFRDTVAEFKRFQAAKQLPGSVIKPETRLAFEKSLAKIPLADASAKDLAPLLKAPAASQALLRDKARELEKQAELLRKLAENVHHERCVADLAELFKQPEAKVDLATAALLIARFDNEELDVDYYRGELDRLAKMVRGRIKKDGTAQAAIEELNKFLFQERGFHGSRGDYYSRSNSYLNEVLDDREGLPITLSVVYIEIARRLDLKVVGVPLPGHFVVRHEPKVGEPQIIDVYEGKFITRKEAAAKVKAITGRAATDADFEPVAKKALVVRMLHNLLNVAESEKDGASMLRYLDGILAVDPDSHDDRWVRAVFRFQAGQRAGALDDCEHLIAADPPGVDLDRVRELRRILQKR